MNHQNPHDGRGEFTLAVVRLPAAAGKPYRGPLFLNFGGPGVTSVQSLLYQYDWSAPPNFPGYDLVTWNTRAVGATLPAIQCYPSEEVRSESRKLRFGETPIQSNLSIAILDADHKLLESACKQKHADLIPFVGTVSTARDMLHMSNVYGFSPQLTYM